MFTAAPNLTDYTSFLRTVVGIKAALLPDAADIIPTTLAIAKELVNEQLCAASSLMYTLAVYNLAADRLINYAPDVPEQTFFSDLRRTLRISDVSLGVVSASSDEGSSMAYLNPEQLKMLTLQDLQTLKTPYGRTYLGIAQSIGTNWGLS